MGSEDLVCARCLGLVVEGRCPTCRASWEYQRRNSPTLSPQLLLVILTVVLLLAALAVRHVN